jgi:hypothetical protein
MPFFLASLWNLFKFRSQENPKRFPFLPFSLSPIHAFAFSWLLVPLVFFSFSGSKLPGYILPALPGALILTADYVSRFAGKSKTRENNLKLMAAGMFILVFIILQFFIDDFARRDTVKYLIGEANAQGFANARILTLHNISHNAEFYGAGRLVRLPDGKQRYFYGIMEISEHIRLNDNQAVLVLVPLEYLKDLTESELVSAKVLGDNGETAIAAVNLK